MNIIPYLTSHMKVVRVHVVQGCQLPFEHYLSDELKTLQTLHL